MNKLQEQNSKINISDYVDGIEWLAIHEKYFYEKLLEKTLSFSDNKIILNKLAKFESVVNAPPIKIQANSILSSDIHLDDDFNYSECEKLIKNISGKKEIYLPNQEDWISEDNFLRLAEEKINQNIIESKPINRKSPKNK